MKTLKIGLPVILVLTGTAVYAQKVTVSRKDAPLALIFKDIRNQIGYDFFYSDSVVPPSIRKTINVSNAPLNEVLDEIFKGTNLLYIIKKGRINISAVSTMQEDSVVRGRVVDEEGRPVQNVTVSVIGTRMFAVANAEGEFKFRHFPKSAQVIFTSVGYEQKQVVLHKVDDVQEIKLKLAVKGLDETVVIAYGKTSTRLYAGNVAKVGFSEIEKQPISNPVESLVGRVAGLSVTQSNGMPGSSYKVQLRGQNSLAQGTQPLYIVDDIPLLFDRGIGQIVYLNNQDPINIINPGDIESIMVLKDASATAIYGSQGANGVILISTKKGKQGKAKLEMNVYTGISKVGETPAMLNGRQYLEMRREGFKNDHVTPTRQNAPDLLVWDTGRFTDWKKELIGETANSISARAVVSGGNANSQYFVSGGFYRTGMVFPDSKNSDKSTFRANLNLQSDDGRFKASLSTSYGVDNRSFPGEDITKHMYLPPDAPPMYDSLGKLRWSNGLDNPLSYTKKDFSGQNSNLSGNAVLNYVSEKGISFKVNSGYNLLRNEEQLLNPIRSQQPSPVVEGSMSLGTAKYISWIIEPQAMYHARLGAGVLDLLAGVSWQKKENKGSLINGTKYKDDDLLGNISAAPELSSSNYFSEYNYNAFFGRINYSLLNRYIADINIRRDGSSRFGPANRYSNFGSGGVAWIFTNEPVAEKLSFLSFGKLRATMGVSGNDQIGDYRYYDTWLINEVANYDSLTGLLPQELYNPELKWERSLKREVGVNLGFLNDRFLIAVTYYNNISNNQLVRTNIPVQTGFNNVLKNLDARILNRGFEIEIAMKSIKTVDFSWNTFINLSIPNNKLVKYPGLENSADVFKYKIGEPLSVRFGYDYEKVDPLTGVYTFRDLNNDGSITTPDDIQVIGNREKKYYGGVQNNFKFKRFECDLFLQFIKQTGNDWITTMIRRPGQMWNQPVTVLNRWEKMGDEAPTQAWSTVTYTPQYKAFTSLQNSDASLVDASFVKLKTAMISYNVKVPEKIKISKLKVYVEGQNIFTISGYKGLDPEIQTLTSLPLLRTIVCGLQLVF